MQKDRLILVILALSVASLVCALTNQILLFSLSTGAFALLGFLLAYGREARRPAILAGLALFFVLYLALMIGINVTFDPTGGLDLLGGLPVPTALLIYGIWPLGIVTGVLYFLVFRKSILSDSKLEKFLRDFGGGSNNR
jgi:hypothetical protein